MTFNIPMRLPLAMLTVIGMCGPGVGHARDRVDPRRPALHAKSRVSIGQAHAAAVRDLTINRLPQGYGPDVGTDDDIFLDGPIRYNNIRSFDPAPYADSGRQYPLGLDGIGGYGSDLGFSAGHDGVVYDRGF